MDPLMRMIFPADPVTSKLSEEEFANLGVVMGAYDSFCGARRAHLAYVSMPITTGKRLYDVLLMEDCRTVEVFTAKCGKEALFERVIRPNIREGIAFADSLSSRENLLFIAPSVFEAKRWRWSQDAYMSLWYRVIGEMAGKLVVQDGWEFSTGGMDEVMFALFLHWCILRSTTLKDGVELFNLRNFQPSMNFVEVVCELEAMWAMRIYDARGTEMRLLDVLEKCLAAVEHLRERNFSCQGLLRRTAKISRIPFFTPSFYEPDCDEGEGGSIHRSPRFETIRRKIRDLVADAER